MKKIYSSIVLFLFCLALQSQTVVYDITSSGLTASDCPGCNCSATGEYYLGSPLNISWTSTGAATPTSVNLEIYELWNDGGSGIPVTLNGASDGSYGAVNSCGALVVSIPLTPANYAVGGSNTVDLDYNAIFATYEIGDNSAWGAGVYARVTVVYPVAPGPPVANTDYYTVSGGTTGNIFDVQANDTDPNGDLLVTNLMAPPTSGGNATVLNGDSVSYDPPAGFCGLDTITYQVCDPTPFCDKDTIFVTVTDGEAPVVACQNIDVYLDSSGTATITAADVDGGTTDNCSPFSMSIDINSFNCGDIVPPSANSLAISAAYDGPLSGGVPKGIELYALNAIADLSMYGVGSANNGGGTDGEEFTFPAVSVAAGQFIYVTSDSAGFRDFFGFDADYIDNSMGINGDDAIELFHMGSAVDVFGDINTDGTGEPWDYMDGWAYSNDTRVLGTTFDHNDWRFSGTNALDGAISNMFATFPVPLASYSPALGGTSVTLTATDSLSNTDFCVAAVTVLDTLSPYFMNCPSNVSIASSDSGCLAIVTWTAPTEMDNCASGLTVSSSHNSGDIFPQGITTVTYTVTDVSGNSGSCSFDVEVTSGLMASAATTNAVCNGDTNGTAVITITGNVGPSSVDWGMMSGSGLPAGTHTYTVTDSIGCTLTDSVSISQPDILALSSSITDEIASGSNGEIDLTVTGGNGGYTYDWDNDGTGDNDDTEDLTGLSTGTYVVIVTDSLGCSDSISVFVDNVSSVLENNGKGNITLFPNPSDGLFNVNLSNYSNTTIEVVDVIGNIIAVVQNPGNSNRIDISDESAGVYLVKITSREKLITRRIVVRK